MSKFTGPLTLTHLEADDWRHWRIESPLRYTRNSGGFVEVPVGFITDGTSVPRPLWSLLPTWGRHSRASVVHDYLYDRLRAGTPDPIATSRAKADAVFYEALRDCGVNVVWRSIMWAAVRVGGMFTV